jgi:hypothetical protein
MAVINNHVGGDPSRDEAYYYNAYQDLTEEKYGYRVSLDPNNLDHFQPGVSSYDVLQLVYEHFEAEEFYGNYAEHLNSNGLVMTNYRKSNGNLHNAIIYEIDDDTVYFYDTDTGKTSTMNKSDIVGDYHAVITGKKQ